MPPKTQFTKEQIIDSAFNLVINKGIDALSARILAKELGSSVAPIYVNFKNTNELLEAVITKVSQVVWQYSTKPYTKHGFFNIGIGQLLIARDFPLLFKDITIKYPQTMDLDIGFWEKMLDIMEEDPLLDGLSRNQCQSILEKMALQTCGLAIEIAKNNSTLTIKKALRIMEETAFQIIYAEKSNEYKQLGLDINFDIIG